MPIAAATRAALGCQAIGWTPVAHAATLTERLNDEIRKAEQLHMELHFARQARADDAELVTKLDLQVYYSLGAFHRRGPPEAVARFQLTGIV